MTLPGGIIPDQFLPQYGKLDIENIKIWIREISKISEFLVFQNSGLIRLIFKINTYIGREMRKDVNRGPQLYVWKSNNFFWNLVNWTELVPVNFRFPRGIFRVLEWKIPIESSCTNRLWIHFNSHPTSRLFFFAKKLKIRISFCVFW